MLVACSLQPVDKQLGWSGVVWVLTAFGPFWAPSSGAATLQVSTRKPGSRDLKAKLRCPPFSFDRELHIPLDTRQEGQRTSFSLRLCLCLGQRKNSFKSCSIILRRASG
ncbi:hypothetical protein ACLKA7_016689 [Drosophila subpalustris]